MRTSGLILAIVCLLPGAGSAQGRLGAPPIPQIPTAVTHIPQIPTVPTLPAIPMTPPTAAIPPAAIPPAAVLHLPSLHLPSALPLAALAHGPPSVALAHVQVQSSGEPGQANARQLRQADMARAAPGLLEIDRRGQLVLRGQVLVTGADARTLADARRLGFDVADRVRLTSLGLDLTVLRAPGPMAVDDALDRLRAAEPGREFEADPVYETAGAADQPKDPPRATVARGGKPMDVGPVDSIHVGLVDSGVAANHPALSGSRIVQQGFAAGGPTPSEHGTAIASLISGEAGGYRGVAPHSTLYVADVYGSGPGGGSASAVAKAIDWLVRNKTPVINISLVGPASGLLEKAIDAAVDKGAVVVAAVGNEGPFSPPLYPAAYRNVVAVTAVDRRNAILAEAVRSTPVAFAAPGADILAAHLGGGFEEVRGTSFAAPIVAAELALDHRKFGRHDALQALGRMQRRATKAPAAKSPAAYGWGLVGVDLRRGLAGPASGGLIALGGK